MVTSSAGQLLLDAQATSFPSTTTYSNPTTMSSRRQSRRVNKADVDYKEDDDSGPSEDEAVPTSTKRRKTTGGGQKKVTKRRKGKLSKLPDMPLDVLYEVTFRQPQGIERY